MAYEHREGQGALFRNNKGDNEKRPDMRGTVMVGGVVYRISAWEKDGARGRFLSLKLEPEPDDAGKAPF